MAASGSRCRAAAAAATVALGLASLTIFVEGIGFSRLEDADVVDFRRQPSSYFSLYEKAAKKLIETGTFNGSDVSISGAGHAGVALFDIDGDGDLDMFVPTGPGQENALFINKLVPEGTFEFTTTCDGQSCASAFGLAFPELDGNGLCTGDIDNDGDQDLVILNIDSAWQLLRNDGGTFAEVSLEPQDITEGYGPTSCTFGDVDGDGLVDLAISFLVDFPLSVPKFHTNPRKVRLFINKGPEADFHFVDESNIRGFEAAEAKNISWSVALVDYDMDGDVDLFIFDDRATLTPETNAFGLVKLWQNDGSGAFEFVHKEESGLLSSGTNMGYIFADFNCDGNLDFYTTRGGSIQEAFFLRMANATEEEVLQMFQEESTQLAFGLGNGTFQMKPPQDPSGNNLFPPFGWGIVAEDFDNDGDTDVAYTGGLLMSIVMLASPGVVLENHDCTGMFTSSNALKHSDYGKYAIRGTAAGDLNDDGFVDFVAVAGAVYPDDANIIPLKDIEPDFALEAQKNSPFLDDLATYFAFQGPDFKPAWGGSFDEEENPVLANPGLVAVEMNDASSNNNWVKIKLRGSIGDVEGAKVNRDGTGAIISFTPNGGPTSIIPLTSGLLMGSNDKTKIFGLGSETEGQLVVMWPGKIYNTLKVFSGETVVMPEIPCSAVSFEDDGQFSECVADSLSTLLEKGIIDEQMSIDCLNRWLKDLTHLTYEEYDLVQRQFVE